jgi:NAD(P)H dehydrogenase (quinone)
MLQKQGDLALNIFIVYAHPSEDSFTRYVRDSFIEGLKTAGHSYIISDLYKMGFNSDMSEAKYLREANYRDDLPLAGDVIAEQNKINSCDAIVFIYPVFWTEAPAKLVGWFNRVWTYGFAYGNRSMKQLEKALVICVAGHSLQHLKEYGHYDAMKTVMLGDRLHDRVKEKSFILLDSTTKSDMKARESNWDKHLKTAFEAGRAF